MCPIALNHSIDGDGKCVWHVNVLVQEISLFSEVGFADWKVIDAGSRAVIEAVHHIDEACVMNDAFAILNACGSQVDVGAGGGFM